MTHGESKSKDSLLEGLAIALDWVLKNYWQWESKHRHQDSVEGKAKF
jgi:hypothetical protein